MITLNGNTYKLCLIDTNAASEMVKRPDPIMRHFFEAIKPNEYIPCFSVFTILELREREDIYKRFLETFSIFPVLFLRVSTSCFKMNSLLIQTIKRFRQFSFPRQAFLRRRIKNLLTY